MARNSGQDLQIMQALARGLSQETAAALAGCSVRTVRRRLSDASFADGVSRLQQELVSQSVGLLTAELTSSVKQLAAVRDHAESDATKLQAARCLIELTIRMREFAVLEPRIREIERFQKATKTSRGTLTHHM